MHARLFHTHRQSSNRRSAPKPTAAALCVGAAASAPGGPTSTIIFHSWVRHTAALGKRELGGLEDGVGQGGRVEEL